jgi:hypothetical protein
VLLPPQKFVGNATEAYPDVKVTPNFTKISQLVYVVIMLSVSSGIRTGGRTDRQTDRQSTFYYYTLSTYDCNMKFHWSSYSRYHQTEVLRSVATLFYILIKIISIKATRFSQISHHSLNSASVARSPLLHCYRHPMFLFLTMQSNVEMSLSFCIQTK